MRYSGEYEYILNDNNNNMSNVHMSYVVISYFLIVLFGNIITKWLKIHDTHFNNKSIKVI